MPILLHENRLVFGAPLEDISPIGDINPTLKEVIKISYIAITDGCINVSEIIRAHQGGMKQRLDVKDALATTGSIYSPNISPGSYLWVLRHFLGLMPLSLLPPYINGCRCDWTNLAQLCREIFTTYAYSRINEIILKIANHLNMLPDTNYLLVYALFELLWELTIWPHEYINKKSLMSLSKYFSSSIFLRPYRPGYVTAIDREYFPLMMFMVAKWPEIRKLSSDRISQSFIRSLDPRHENQCPSFRISTQTCEPSFKNLDATNVGNKYLQTIIENEETETFSEGRVSTSTQTLESSFRNQKSVNTDRHTRKCCCLYKHNFDKLVEQFGDKSTAVYLQRTVIFKYKPCCCTYSSNYDSESNSIGKNTDECSIKDKMYPDLQDYFNEPLQTPEEKMRTEEIEGQDYGWSPAILNLIRHQKFEENYENAPDSNTYEEEYIYDDYRDLQNKNSTPKDNDMLAKVSKIGWTYTPPSPKLEASSSNSLLNKTWEAANKENYSIYFDAEEKDVDEGVVEKNNVEENVMLSPRNEDVKKTKSKKSLAAFDSIKSKLGFLKSLYKKNLKSSMSAEDMSSKVKYMKMDSAKSSTF